MVCYWFLFCYSPYVDCSGVDTRVILDTYSLEEILELNDLTEAEALQFMLDQDFIRLPEVLPLDYE